MISYEVYKILHVFSIIIFFSTAGAQLMGKSEGKLPKILGGIASFLILLGGMGLLARIGVSHKEGWPAWAIGKAVIWLVLVVMVPVVAKRFSAQAKAAWWACLALAFTATYLAVTHS